MLRLLAYNATLTLAAPLAAAGLLCAPRHRALLGRFRPVVPAGLERPLWLHACSVGETAAARLLIRAATKRWPEIPILLTASTVSGRAQADTISDAAIAWCPWDHPFSVRGFLERARPRALALVETELWPNLLREAHRADVPVALLSGRLSDARFDGFQRWRGLFQPLVGSLRLAAMQNETYASRIAELGARAEAIHVTGNVKYDLDITPMSAEERVALRREHGFTDKDLVVILGSARPGDEELAAQCWSTLRERHPALRFIIAPRHMDRLAEARQAFSGEPVQLRSETRQGQSPRGERILFLDTVGELSRFYAIGDIAVIGGSFFPGVEGHNPIEPAALGVPVVFGPHMRNFADPAKALVETGGAIAVDAPSSLLGALQTLLDDPAQRTVTGERARTAIAANRGAIGRTLDLLAPLLGAR